MANRVGAGLRDVRDVEAGAHQQQRLLRRRVQALQLRGGGHVSPTGWPHVARRLRRSAAAAQGFRLRVTLQLLHVHVAEEVEHGGDDVQAEVEAQLQLPVARPAAPGFVCTAAQRQRVTGAEEALGGLLEVLQQLHGRHVRCVHALPGRLCTLAVGQLPVAGVPGESSQCRAR